MPGMTRILLLAALLGSQLGCESLKAKARAVLSKESASPPTASSEPQQAKTAATKDSATIAVSAEPEKPEISLPANLNVLLLTIDSMRADMPWNGYPRPIAPNLTRLAEQSVVYTHAYSLCSATTMALGGMMASRYPLQVPRDGKATSGFPPEAHFLAEVLQAGNVRTLGVHGHVFFYGANGIDQGFDEWRFIKYVTARTSREGAITDDRLATLLVKTMDAHVAKEPSQPFFAWTHFMDPHFRYNRHPGIEPYVGSPYKGAKGQEDKPMVSPGVPLSDVGQQLRNGYDGEVTFTDKHVGRVLDHVRQQPWGKRTAIIVSADHGEAFGEQKSYFEHGFLLYEVTVRVPLIIYIPGVPPRRIDTRRSTVDLAPTILQLFGLKSPESFVGTSLVPEVLGEKVPERRVVLDYPYTDQNQRRRAIIDSSVKIIASENELEPKLFDLSKDPGEQNDLAAKDSKLLSEMKAKLEETETKFPDFPAPRLKGRHY